MRVTVFGRRRRAPGRHARAAKTAEGAKPTEPTEDTESTEDGATPPYALAHPGEPVPSAARPAGPWDDAERAPELTRVDLGALRVPVFEGVSVALSLQEQEVVAARVTHHTNTLQLQAFAAPKSGGLWSEVWHEIAERLRGGGHEVTEAESPFGNALSAELPVQTEQGAVRQAARFVGVDGPRWMLRGVFTGPTESEPTQDRVLADVFLGTVVVRGDAPVPPRERLPLQAPPTAGQDRPDAGQDPPAAG